MTKEYDLRQGKDALGKKIKNEFDTRDEQIGVVNHTAVTHEISLSNRVERLASAVTDVVDHSEDVRLRLKQRIETMQTRLSNLLQYVTLLSRSKCI